VEEGHTVAFNIQHNRWRQDLVPPIDHPYYPSRIYLPNKRYGNVREAGNAAEWVGEGCVGEEVGVQRVFLVGGRAFGEEVDYVGNLPFWIGGLG